MAEAKVEMAESARGRRLRDEPLLQMPWCRVYAMVASAEPWADRMIPLAASWSSDEGE